MRVHECPLSVPEPRPQLTSADPSSCQRKASPSPPPSCTLSPPHTSTYSSECHITTCARPHSRGLYLELSATKQLLPALLSDLSLVVLHPLHHAAVTSNQLRSHLTHTRHLSHLHTSHLTHTRHLSHLHTSHLTYTHVTCLRLKGVCVEVVVSTLTEGVNTLPARAGGDGEQ